MTNQYPYLAGYQKGSATSKAAAEKIETDRLTIEKQVYGFIESQGALGATWKMVSDRLTISSRAVQPRFTELKLRGLIEPVGYTIEGCEVMKVCAAYQTSASKSKSAPKTKHEYHAAAAKALAYLEMGQNELARLVLAKVIKPS